MPMNKGISPLFFCLFISLKIILINAITKDNMDMFKNETNKISKKNYSLDEARKKWDDFRKK